jgi:hypothetical protein
MDKLRFARCHERAAECLDAAQRAATPEVRQAYLDLMKQWIELADRTAQPRPGSSQPITLDDVEP